MLASALYNPESVNSYANPNSLLCGDTGQVASGSGEPASLMLVIVRSGSKAAVGTCPRWVGFSSESRPRTGHVRHRRVEERKPSVPGADEDISWLENSMSISEGIDSIEALFSLVTRGVIASAWGKGQRFSGAVTPWNGSQCGPEIQRLCRHDARSTSSSNPSPSDVARRRSPVGRRSRVRAVEHLVFAGYQNETGL
jgi:hypothetical protein